MGCSSEEPSPVVPAPGINCLVEPDFLGSAKGTLGVKWKGTWSGACVGSQGQRLWCLSLINVALTRLLYLLLYMQLEVNSHYQLNHVKYSVQDST